MFCPEYPATTTPPLPRAMVMGRSVKVALWHNIKFRRDIQPR